MAGIGAALQIGQSALAAYQAAINITGQNIANVGNATYTRQSGRLAAEYGGSAGASVAPGVGVRLSELRRHVDEAVEQRLRLALGARSGAEVTYETLNRVEALYNELTEYDLSSQLSDFFQQLSNLQTDPVEMSTRSLVLATADAMTQTIQRHRTGLLDQIDDANDRIQQATNNANAITQEVARLNQLIVTAEAHASGKVGALRDRRDALLRDLGELMDIRTREQENGIVNVYIGSEPLVNFDRSRGLTTQMVTEDGVERVEVRFADNHGSVIMREGKLAASVRARDEHLIDQLAKLDQLSRAVIYELNRAQTSGRGLSGYEQITGTYGADDADAALSSTEANLTFPVENGTFLVHMRDQVSGREISRMIQVDLDGIGNDTTLNDLVAALDAVPNLNASLTLDNRLVLQTDNGFEVSFREDTSGVLAALGVGTFFDGQDAGTIAVHESLVANPRLIAASQDGTPGDGSNAGRLAAAGDVSSSLLGNLSILDFQANMTNGLAVAAGAATTAHEAADAVYASLLAQRESISGVNLDEEAIDLMKFERSFQGASRFLTVVDTLAAEVMSLVS